MSRSAKQRGFSRRQMLRLLAHAGYLTPFAGGLSPFLLSTPARGAGTSHKFMQIFLSGGWDANLATDPVPVGSPKAHVDHYWPAYWNAADPSYAGVPQTVAGKSNLLVGAGMAPAMPAFALAPTAFVNGLFVEVTAHELAINYLFSGRLSLSRSREYPSMTSLMADRTGGFPAHVIVGGGAMPLGDTAKTNPPLQAVDSGTFIKMLAGPHHADSGMSETSIDAADTLLGQLNSQFQSRVGGKGRASLATWNGSEAGLKSLYDKRFDQRLDFTQGDIQADFQTGTGQAFDANGIGARLALAHMILREGVSRYVTVFVDGFDTHTSHMSLHKPLMQTVASRINTLITYLSETSDPDIPSKKLLETTTVLITSEFNRTPLANKANGTDHWQTGTAIVMGRGVQDNTVIGGTDLDGKATDYNGAPLLPDHLAASLLRHLGFATEAQVISGVHLSALLT